MKQRKLLKVKHFRQTPGLCGPASLKITFSFFGKNYSEKKLAQLTGATIKKGVEPDDLIKAGRRLGFKTYAKEFGKISDLDYFINKRQLPVIVGWFSKDEGHYSVAIGLDKKFIYLADPEKGGLRKITKERFKKIWFDFKGEIINSKSDLILRWFLVISPWTLKQCLEKEIRKTKNIE